MKMRFLFLFLFLLSLSASSQKIELVIESDLKKFQPKYKANCANEKEIQKEVNKVFNQLYVEGYLAAIILSDTLIEQKRLINVKVGEQYLTGKIKKGNAEEKMLSVIGYREKIYSNKILSQNIISELAKKTLEYYENNGYPFATFQLDSLHLINQSLNASMKINKGRFCKIDSLILKGGAKINQSYIENYINVEEGGVYNEKIIRAIDTRIKEIAFLELIKPTEIVFTETQCFVYIYVKDKKASQFNGVLGLLPDNITGKITVTGDARIRLKNTFHAGELLDFNWRKLNNNIQDMRINVNYPFLFNTAFGVDGIFKLYKKDTTFIELNLKGSLQYLLKTGNFLKISYQQQSTSLITPSMFSNVTVLPNFSDVKTNSYGIGTKLEKLDYRLNPRKGFSFEIDLQVGFKNIKKLPELNDSLYSNLNLKTVKYGLESEFAVFIPAFKRTTIKIGNQTGWVENENLFINELYRLGGIRKLRGFNEESIFASFYTINTLEFRYLLEQNSNIYFFTDYAYYENKIVNSFTHDTPISFGAGISFQTKAGIFSMNYAIGKELENPFLLRGAKIHFGFINYF